MQLLNIQRVQLPFVVVLGYSCCCASSSIASCFIGIHVYRRYILMIQYIFILKTNLYYTSSACADTVTWFEKLLNHLLGYGFWFSLSREKKICVCTFARCSIVSMYDDVWWRYGKFNNAHRREKAFFYTRKKKQQHWITFGTKATMS